MRTLVIDTDTASDDAVALMMALRRPEVDVKAITVVAGNVPVDQAVQNALYVVDLCGRPVPVHAGAMQPLIQPLVTAEETHGQDGMGDIGLPLSDRTPTDGHAVDVLIDTFLAQPGEIDLVTLGPLTTVALALTRAPELAGAIAHCYIMGGTGAGHGNVTPLAEYNFWVDPEAAAVVVRAPIPKTIIGWDVSVASATFSPEEAARLRSIGTPYAEPAVDCQAVLDELARKTMGLAGFDLPDPIAMAVALDPSIASTSHLHVEVLTGAGPARGVQNTDWQGYTGRPPNARVVRYRQLRKGERAGGTIRLYGLRQMALVRHTGRWHRRCWGNDYFGETNAPEGRFDSLAVGEFVSCGLRADGSFVCWGQGSGYLPEWLEALRFRAPAPASYHTCGLSTSGRIYCWGSAAAYNFDLPEGTFTAITSGYSHSCGIRTDGTVTCWGDRPVAPAPEGVRGVVHSPATPSYQGGPFTAVTAGSGHACGILAGGTVKCWGSNVGGQSEAVDGPFLAVAAGGRHSCGIRTHGTVSCWGLEDSPGYRLEVPHGRFTIVSAGRVHVCGLRADGTVTCWGNNDAGRLNTPSGKFTAVSAGHDHSCALDTGGTVTCWGNNRSGQADAPEGQFTAVSAGGSHSCALDTGGTVTCWGNNRSGQADAPEGQFTAVTTGEVYSCGLQTDGYVTCWGDDRYGLAAVPEGRFTTLVGGWSHNCGLRPDGTVTCWGNNRFGQADPPDGPYTAVSTFSEHTCALSAGGAVSCWGRNQRGQTDVPDEPFTALAAGGAHSCAQRVDGGVSCWGNNTSGQAEPPEGRFTAVGVADTSSCGIRVDGTVTCWGLRVEEWPISPTTRFTALAAGFRHWCGIRTDGTVVCWGENRDGQAEAPEGRFTAVVGGYRHSCGLRTDGTVACWGRSWTLPPPPGVQEVTSSGNPADPLGQ